MICLKKKKDEDRVIVPDTFCVHHLITCNPTEALIMMMISGAAVDLKGEQ